MRIYLITYVISFIFSRLGWFFPSGLVLMAGALYLYWKDYRASGSFIHLRGLFGLFFVGGQAISCLKLSRLQSQWQIMTWLCFLAVVLAFYGSFSLTENWAGPPKMPHWIKKQAGGRLPVLPQESRREFRRYEHTLFVSVIAVTLISLAAFLLEVLLLGYVPLFVRDMPHAYSYFHISGLHYFTVSCVLTPSLAVLFFMAMDVHRRERRIIVLIFTLISLFIPVLCVSRFQLIFAVGMAVFTFLSVKHRLPFIRVFLVAGLMIPAYLVLTVARSHSVEYLNGIFAMKNPATPIFITQPYIYIANNYDNFNCLVEELAAYTLGRRMLFPVFALTGLKFLKPEWVVYPIYSTKPELTTLTLIYDAYYDFGFLGVVVFGIILGAVCALLVRGISYIKNPVGHVFYAQMAMYMALSFFTTWFSNPATWFYFAVTGAVYWYVEYR